MIDLKALIKSGVHFGHQTSRWSPKMEPYIWGTKNGIHLINVQTTATLLEKAAKFLESVAAEGKSILWVGTKKAAQKTIEQMARDLRMPFVVHRWVGGTFSNYRQVRKSVANLLQYEDIIAKSEQLHYNKKELNLYQKRIDRLEKNVGGIRHLAWPVGAVVIVDVKKEHVCVKEALATGIPIVALVDTNSDPSGITHVIPSNDDVPRSISILIEYLAQATKRGQETAAVKPQEQSAEDIMSSVLETLPGFEEEEEEAKKRRSSSGPRSAKKAPAAKPFRRPSGNAPAKKFSEETTITADEKTADSQTSAQASESTTGSSSQE